MITAREEVISFAIEMLCTGKTSAKRSLSSAIRYANHQIKNSDAYIQVTKKDLLKFSDPMGVRNGILQGIRLLKYCKNLARKEQKVRAVPKRKRLPLRRSR